MAKDYKKLAEEIVNNIGGAENVTHLEHCSTRLRFSIKDQSKVKMDDLKKVSGVMGVVKTGTQTQVVIGNDVIEAYDEVIKLGTFEAGGTVADDKDDKQNVGFGEKVLDFLVGVFQPLVPAIAGAGILKAFLSLFVLVGWLSNTSPVYTLLFNAADAALYFLPLMVAATMSKKLNMNQVTAVAIVGVTIIPSITNALANGIAVGSFTLQNIAYAYQVFPALLIVGVLYYVEKFFNKVSPKAIRIFFVPMMCFIIMTPLTLFVLGPLGFNIGQIITVIILWLYNTLGWVAVALLAAILPFMISMGMHKALLPYAVSSITNAGFEVLYLPASLAHNISEGGACLAVALKTKNENLRAAALSAGISGIFGITEPALYGVTLQHRKAMAGVVTGAFVGGLVVGLAHIKAFVAMGPGLAGMAMFVDPANASNIVWAFAGFAVSLVVSFIVTFILFKDEA
ncbi:MAG: PTS transporter subunit EIIC [Erysipelotrichaceae bacterium]|nr:PTS transporter subunit EIIC [Erysipelotrichaceae bacterium]MDY6034351.1 PTS transporter subunit EIIC [Bulleidia sp.]